VLVELLDADDLVTERLGPRSILLRLCGFVFWSSLLTLLGPEHPLVAKLGNAYGLENGVEHGGATCWRCGCRLLLWSGLWKVGGAEHREATGHGWRRNRDTEISTNILELNGVGADTENTLAILDGGVVGEVLRSLLGGTGSDDTGNLEDVEDLLHSNADFCTRRAARLRDTVLGALDKTLEGVAPGGFVWGFVRREIVLKSLVEVSIACGRGLEQSVETSSFSHCDGIEIE
jgi:hypothetical protein